MAAARGWGSAGGLIAMVALGCEGVLGLDWTPVEPDAANEGGGGSDAAPPAQSGGADHGPASGGGATVAGGGDGFNSSDAGACVAEQCPTPSNACLLPGCVGGECVVVFAPVGAPCGAAATATCDGAGSCGACNVDSDCIGLGAACGEHVCSSCEDGLANAAETDIDCGGPVCGPCSKGDTCIVDQDCKQNLECAAGTCVKG